MLGKLAYLKERLDTSIWLIPVGLCIVSALLAGFMLWLDRQAGLTNLWLFGTGTSLSAARQILAVVAGSIISVGGVAFSVTMVSLTLTSGQYGPKIIRNILEDNASKTSLGLFLGTYIYTLFVMSGYLPTDKPHFSLIFSLVMAAITLLAFVQFIHRTATDLQADRIVHRIGLQLQNALSMMTQPKTEYTQDSQTLPWRRAARSHRARQVAAQIEGYVQTVDYDKLMQWCIEHDCRLQVQVRAGDFIVVGSCLMKAYGGDEKKLEESASTLNGYLVIGPIRTPIQDPEYAITQLNQLAARALSPGVNDPGSAITCIDWFSLALAKIIDKDIPGGVFANEDHGARLLARMSNFNGVLKAIYAPLRQFARSDVSVAIRLIESLCRLAELTARPERLRELAAHSKMIWQEISKQPFAQYDLDDVHQRHIKLLSLTQKGH
ncbi:MAG: DUF2254 domain-containing protein [Chromatiales bacterium]|jgi:uncharacterized membrane protein